MVQSVSALTPGVLGVGSQPRQVAKSPLMAWPRRPAVLSTFSGVSTLWRGHRAASSTEYAPRHVAQHKCSASSKSGRTVKITRRRGSGSSSSGSGLVAVPVDGPTTSRSSGMLASRTTSGRQSSAPPQVREAEYLGPDTGSTSGSGAFAWGWWDSLPSRYKIIVGTAVSFVICNLDKVNLSVCIIPMARDFGWSPTVAGLVQSAFFWGYMLCQLPGGYFNSRLGGRRILPAGVLLYSAATGVVPWVAASVPALCVSRAFVGFGQATAPSAATDMIARAVPPSERARAVTFIFSGFHVGSILGLLAAPWLIGHYGWRSVFVTFGALGFVWWLWFEQGIMSRITAEEPDFATRLVSDSRRIAPMTNADSVTSASSSVVVPAAASKPGTRGAGVAAAAAAAGAAAEPPPLPWRAFLRSTPVRALAYTHFANNWFHYTMLAWLPTYFVDTLSVDLLHASQTALLPPLAGIAASAAAGAAADALISRGVRVPVVRKMAQGIAFLVPTALLLAACTPAVAEDSGLTVAAITVALGISSFSLAGLFCTHQDMSPKYAPILLGLTNTTAAIPGVLGVAAVGYLFEKTQSWEAALFLPSAFFMVTAAATYTLWGRNDPIDFDAADNSPFKFESRLAAIKKAVDDAFDFGLNPSPGSAVEWEVDVPEVRPPPRATSSLLGPLADLVRSGTSSAAASRDGDDEDTASGGVRRRSAGVGNATSRNTTGSGRKTTGGSGTGSGRRATGSSTGRRSTGGSQSKTTGSGRRARQAQAEPEEGPGGVWERLRSLLGQPREY